MCVCNPPAAARPPAAQSGRTHQVSELLLLITLASDPPGRPPGNIKPSDVPFRPQRRPQGKAAQQELCTLQRSTAQRAHGLRRQHGQRQPMAMCRHARPTADTTLLRLPSSAGGEGAWGQRVRRATANMRQTGPSLRRKRRDAMDAADSPPGGGYGRLTRPPTL